jgi:hypothetical protein
MVAELLGKSEVLVIFVLLFEILLNLRPHGFIVYIRDPVIQALSKRPVHALPRVLPEIEALLKTRRDTL